MATLKVLPKCPPEPGHVWRHQFCQGFFDKAYDDITYCRVESVAPNGMVAWTNGTCTLTSELQNSPDWQRVNDYPPINGAVAERIATTISNSVRD